MSWLRLFKRAAPSAPAANYLRLYYDTTGTGTPAAAGIYAIDENSVKAMLAHFTILDYRLITVRVLTSGTSYVPTAGTRAMYVECIAGGGAGGGAATSSSQVSVGAGGGAGAYAASFLTGAQVKNPTTYQVGAGGTAGAAGASGNAGTDSTWDTTVIVAKAGNGGTVLAAGTTLTGLIGPAGGLASGGTGDIKFDGSDGGHAFRFGGSTVNGMSGEGGAAFGGATSTGVVAVTGGTAGNAGRLYGGGGSGGGTSSTATTGGAGGAGVIRVWEFA